MLHSKLALRSWMALAIVLGLGGVTLMLAVGGHVVFEGHSRPGLSVGRTDFDPALAFDLALIVFGALAAVWGWLIARNVEWVDEFQRTRYGSMSVEPSANHSITTSVGSSTPVRSK
ncbi:hypothetical protein ACNOYE_13165 [Nannocystaceae bacterium ST9]